DPATVDRRLDHLAQLGLRRDVLARQRELELEEARVDAAHLGDDATARHRRARRAETGHALHRTSRFSRAASGRSPVARRSCEGLGSPSTSIARTSSGRDTVAVPTFPTTTPAPRLASSAACSSVPPQASARAAIAITVSPAPVTSNT